MLKFYRKPRKSKAVTEISSSDEAQKKFGKAKAISSDQFFGDRTTDVSGCLCPSQKRDLFMLFSLLILVRHQVQHFSL